MKKAFFLDRDGVINKDYGYVFKWANFDVFDKTYEALKIIKNNGFLLIIVTNQSGIARGYYTESAFQVLMNKFRLEAKNRGIEIDGVYYCPHHPEGQIRELSISCLCRKPLPGMILQAAQDHEIELKESYLVGDSVSDINAGLAGGVGNLALINSHENEVYDNFNSLYDFVVRRFGSNGN